MRILLSLFIAIAGAQSANAQIALTSPLPQGVSGIACPGSINGVTEGYRPRLTSGGFGFCVPTACAAGFESAPVNGKCVRPATASWFSRNQIVESADRSVSLRARLSRVQTAQIPVAICPASTAQEGIDYVFAPGSQAQFSTTSNLSEPISLEILRPATDQLDRDIVLALNADCGNPAATIKVTLLSYGISKPELELSFENESGAAVTAAETGEPGLNLVVTPNRILSRNFATPVKVLVGSEERTVMIPKNSTKGTLTLSLQEEGNLEVAVVPGNKFASALPRSLVVTGGIKPTKLSLLEDSLCIFFSNSDLYCVGARNSYSFGDPVTSPALTTLTKAVNLSGASEIWTPKHGAYRCVRTSDGIVKCVGDDNRGQLATDSATSVKFTPTVSVGHADAKKIFGGSNHSCAIMADDTVKCAGMNHLGQLGLGFKSATNVRVAATLAPGLANVKELALGSAFTCALLVDGRVLCTGLNDGRIGLGTVPADISSFTEVPGFTGAKSITSAIENVCAIMADDTVKCTGTSTSYRIGLASSVSVPTTVPGFANVKSFRIGAFHSCAILNSGEVKCVGSGTASGQAVTLTSPMNIPDYFGATQIEMSSVGSGSGYMCAIMADKSVKCSGVNNVGNLAQGHTNTVTGVVTLVLPELSE